MLRRDAPPRERVAVVGSVGCSCGFRATRCSDVILRRERRLQSWVLWVAAVVFVRPDAPAREWVSVRGLCCDVLIPLFLSVGNEMLEKMKVAGVGDKGCGL
ncbi:hypothetical protein L6452_31791 [Arctium lappa]|uniref:Uncharacterized protein n=1 Tax=Arctium lappa TaxID=4217 RepID=A0ACB8Z1Z6_ARCLA|nr:hypothetical protein L6452_31791 [Arctium lappa]